MLYLYFNISFWMVSRRDELVSENLQIIFDDIIWVQAIEYGPQFGQTNVLSRCERCTVWEIVRFESKPTPRSQQVSHIHVTKLQTIEFLVLFRWNRETPKPKTTSATIQHGLESIFFVFINLLAIGC